MGNTVPGSGHLPFGTIYCPKMKVPAKQQSGQRGGVFRHLHRMEPFKILLIKYRTIVGRQRRRRGGVILKERVSQNCMALDIYTETKV